MFDSENTEDDWISIEEEDAPLKSSVLIYSKEGGVAEGERISDNDSNNDYIQYRWNSKVNATHWRKLPRKP